MYINFVFLQACFCATLCNIIFDDRTDLYKSSAVIIDGNVKNEFFNKEYKSLPWWMHELPNGRIEDTLHWKTYDKKSVKMIRDTARLSTEYRENHLVTDCDAWMETDKIFVLYFYCIGPTIFDNLLVIVENDFVKSYFWSPYSGDPFADIEWITTKQKLTINKYPKHKDLLRGILEFECIEYSKTTNTKLAIRFNGPFLVNIKKGKINKDKRLHYYLKNILNNKPISGPLGVPTVISTSPPSGA